MSKKILIVEDNPINQELMSEMLSVLGFDSTIVANGVEALKIVSEGSFDLIFMDLQMPDLDGFETTRRLRKHTSVPIIAVTAQAMQGDREKCLAAGMNGYLSKPFDLAQLEKTLSSYP